MIVVAWDAIRAGLATQQTQYRGALVHAPSLSARTCPHALVVHTRPRAHPSTCTPAHHTHTTHQHHHTKHAIMQTHQHQLAHTHTIKPALAHVPTHAHTVTPTATAKEDVHAGPRLVHGVGLQASLHAVRRFRRRPSRGATDCERSAARRLVVASRTARGRMRTTIDPNNNNNNNCGVARAPKAESPVVVVGRRRRVTRPAWWRPRVAATVGSSCKRDNTQKPSLSSAWRRQGKVLPRVD